jgi:hypothetical protein
VALGHYYACTKKTCAQFFCLYLRKIPFLPYILIERSRCFLSLDAGYCIFNSYTANLWAAANIGVKVIKF